MQMYGARACFLRVRLDIRAPVAQDVGASSPLRGGEPSPWAWPAGSASFEEQWRCPRAPQRRGTVIPVRTYRRAFLQYACPCALVSEPSYFLVFLGRW